MKSEGAGGDRKWGTRYAEFETEAAVDMRQRVCELALDALDGRKTLNEAVEEMIKLKLKLMSGKYNAPHFLRLAFARYGRLWPDNDFYIMNSSNEEYYQQLRKEHGIDDTAAFRAKLRAYANAQGLLSGEGAGRRCEFIANLDPPRLGYALCMKRH